MSLLFSLLLCLVACDAVPTAPRASAEPASVALSNARAAASEKARAAWDSLRVLGEPPLVILDGVILREEALAGIASADLAAVEFAKGSCCFGPCTPRQIAIFTRKQPAAR